MRFNTFKRVNHFPNNPSLKIFIYFLGKRLSDPTWNGVVWRKSDGVCEVLQDDRGHRSTSDGGWLHFKAI